MYIFLQNTKVFNIFTSFISMYHFNLCLLFMIIHLQADFVYSQNEDISQDVVTSYEPSLPVVIGVLCFMFFLICTLLLFAKFCGRRASRRRRAAQEIQPGIGLPEPRISGIDKKVIESLPFFRFSSLKGSKDGLECAVCLSRFEDIEILRLLPKCRHAFHSRCIDQWLEKHSTCPLCRQIVSAMDLTSFTYSGSFRLLGIQSGVREDSDMELFVQREEEHQRSSRRFSIGDSFRTIEKCIKQDESLVKESATTRSDDQELFHKFNHKIVASDVLNKNRWSSVSSSDLVFLNSEIFDTNSNSRLSDLGSEYGKLTCKSRITENCDLMKIKEEMEMKILLENRIFAMSRHNTDIPSTSSNKNAQESSIQMSRFGTPGEKRSMSEITGLSRYEEFRMKNKMIVPCLLENNVNNERLRQLWLLMARKTVGWFANNEGRSHSQAAQDTRQSVDV